MDPLYDWKITDFFGKMVEEDCRHLTSNHMHGIMMSFNRKKKWGKKCVNVNLQHIAYINWIQMGTQELCILVVMVTTLHYYYGKSRHVTIPAGDWMGIGI